MFNGALVVVRSHVFLKEHALHTRHPEAFYLYVYLLAGEAQLQGVGHGHCSSRFSCTPP